jgi:hypothetical protein
MKISVWMLGLILSLPVLGFSQKPDLKGAWIANRLQWVADAAYPQNRWAHAQVLYFSDSHFSLLECVIRREGGRLFVSLGDAQGIYRGEWRTKGLGIAIKYKLLYRTVEISGGNAPEEEHNDTLKLSKGTLVFHGATFRKEPRLNASVEKDLRGVDPPDGNP